ncbi:putative la-related protein Larp4B [Cocos nucifera]|uniref:Putative la-related protein Larp4B n=1 Tax=Cocos nucifera TaxID=13894 RepID=A0A8K0IW95_COCNU|nr:putative la-related protein Larp4B [Cocos nucifera]
MEKVEDEDSKRFVGNPGKAEGAKRTLAEEQADEDVGRRGEGTPAVAEEEDGGTRGVASGMERRKLENDRFRHENERMLVLLRHRELELLRSGGGDGDGDGGADNHL